MSTMAKRRSATVSAVARPAPSAALDVPETVEISAGLFKNTCLALMDDVRDGHTQVVITKYGEIVARLVGPETAAPSAFGFLRGTVVVQGDIVSPNFDDWGEPE